MASFVEQKQKYDEKKQSIDVEEESGYFVESPVFNADNRSSLEKLLYDHYISKNIKKYESFPSKASKETLFKIWKHFKNEKLENQNAANINDLFELIYDKTDSLLALNTNDKFSIAELFGGIMAHSQKQWLRRYMFCKESNEWGVRKMLWMIIQHQTVDLITNIYKFPSKIRKHLDECICYSEENKAKDIDDAKRPKYESIDIATVNNDCILTALQLRKEGYNPLLLNLANAYAPAAASHSLSECGSQEENLFKRTSLYLSLWPHKSDKIEHNPYANYDAIFEQDKKGRFVALFGAKRKKETNVFYPMHPEYGAIYSPNVYVLRGSEFVGYPLLPNQQRCVIAMISVAAKSRGGNSAFLKSEIIEFEHKVRTIYKVAYEHNHNVLVLGGLGCGIFRNPPNEVAHIFYRILMDEFQGCFQKVYFAIIWDHHSQPQLIKSFTKYFPLHNQ